jgi:hypothetical protein
MRDAATEVTPLVARMRVVLDEQACRQRNALTVTGAHRFELATGDVGTVLETFGDGEAFLVEFSKAGAAASEAGCEWMGVLYPGEVEVIAPLIDDRQQSIR